MAEECRSCRAEIDWAYKPEPEDDGTVKSNPINRDSADDPAGNLIIWRDGHGVLRFRYRRKGDNPDRAKGEHTGISHFATCPERDKWRKGKAAAKPDVPGPARTAPDNPGQPVRQPDNRTPPPRGATRREIAAGVNDPAVSVDNYVDNLSASLGHWPGGSNGEAARR